MASRDRAQTFEPWTPLAVLLWAAMSLLAGVLIFICWFYASGKTQYNDQRPALNLAVLGAIVATAGGAFVCLAGRRAVGLRRQALLADIPVALLSRSVAPLDIALLTLVGGAGLNRYHRSDCDLSTGRNWAPADREVHEQEGRTPCGVCRP